MPDTGAWAGGKLRAQGPRATQDRASILKGDFHERQQRPRIQAAPGPKGDTTMRFMMLMIPKSYEKAAPGAMPDAKVIAAMMKYNESLQKAGVLLSLEGLHPPSMGARVSFPGGKPKVTDGPFAEAKEVLGGYWMIQVKSREEAIEWAKRCPASENETIEIRQVQELSDFPAENLPPKLGAREQKLRDELESKAAKR